MGLFTDFTDFLKTVVFQKSLNATFIACSVRWPGPNDIKKLKTISLVGSAYKILAKVLALSL